MKFVSVTIGRLLVEPAVVLCRGFCNILHRAGCVCGGFAESPFLKICCAGKMFHGRDSGDSLIWQALPRYELFSDFSVKRIGCAAEPPKPVIQATRRVSRSLHHPN